VHSDVGVYFAVIVGPVAGRFAIQHGDQVRLASSNPSLDRLSLSSILTDNSISVEMAFLRSGNCRRLLFCWSLSLLLSSKASPWLANWPSAPRTRLCRSRSLHVGHDTYSYRHRLHYYPGFIGPYSYRNFVFWLWLPTCFCSMGDFRSSQATLDTHSNLHSRQWKRAHRSFHCWFCRYVYSDSR
jgi:hypothetical protein